ncbi:hypothetical protein [Calothrix sp. NIES-2098]|uniref:hypothetical protein n=1 Tax=Calothrix sp. NIES-2098 TaxID=1954171 RepID=UPI000B5F28AC|nr:hypothetical protein NIES2098_54700 [Calothrix sp. NIES-2098]
METNSGTANLQATNSAEEELSLLPRSAWSSQLAYLKALYKAKQALDKRQK